VGWSGYAGGVIRSAGWPIPEALLAGPAAGGIVNAPAIVISLAVAGLLAIGSRESATVNLVLVTVKLLALAIFIALALPAFDADNFQPFAPFGYGSTEIADGTKQGVMAAAAIIFFAFYGFDAVSTAAEETKNPKRDLKIGIVGSMVLCTFLYMVVAAAALGGSRYQDLANSAEPLAMVLRNLQHPFAATVIAMAAVIALPTVIMAFMYGQSRIFFVMARDGLLPQRLSRVHPRFGTPVLMTFITSIIVAIIAAFVPLQNIAAVANAGTLIAFIAVAVCMMVTRKTHPQHPRIFGAGATWIIGIVAVIGCIYLFSSLQTRTMVSVLIWNVVGLAIYLLWARRKSLLEPAPG
jgi:APA family basic amino acid/polyamine antiporter